jgi:hypothetical protein
MRQGGQAIRQHSHDGEVCSWRFDARPNSVMLLSNSHLRLPTSGATSHRQHRQAGTLAGRWQLVQLSRNVAAHASSAAPRSVAPVLNSLETQQEGLYDALMGHCAAQVTYTSDLWRCSDQAVLRRSVQSWVSRAKELAPGAHNDFHAEHRCTQNRATWMACALFDD